jgi:murein L,D-transpeptidase YcbB/YkuD
MNLRTQSRAHLILVVTSLFVAGGCSKPADGTLYVPAIRTLVSTTPSWVDHSPLGKRVWAIERGFYESRGFTTAWVNGDKTTPQMKDLVQQLLYSEKHGLDPASYHVSEFQEAREASQTKYEGTRFDPARVPELDAKMTYAYLRYAADLLAWGAAPVRST